MLKYHAITCSAVALAAVLGLSACGNAPHAYVADDPETFPRVKFQNGSVSRNDRCPVRKNKLNRGFDPLYVNGRPVGFC